MKRIKIIFCRWQTNRKKYLIMAMLKSTQSFITKENTKSVNQSKIINYQPKTFQNPNVVGIKSNIIEHPKTSHK